jgi:hypothetical protein
MMLIVASLFWFLKTKRRQEQYNQEDDVQIRQKNSDALKFENVLQRNSHDSMIETTV